MLKQHKDLKERLHLDTDAQSCSVGALAQRQQQHTPEDTLCYAGPYSLVRYQGQLWAHKHHFMDLSPIRTMFTWLVQMGALAFLAYMIQQAFMQSSGQQNQRLRNPLVPPATAAPQLPPQPQSSKSKKKKGKQGSQAAAAQEPEVRDQTADSDSCD